MRRKELWQKFPAGQDTGHKQYKYLYRQMLDEGRIMGKGRWNTGSGAARASVTLARLTSGIFMTVFGWTYS